MSRYSLSNLTKPTLIMVSTYIMIYVVAFFIQPDKKDDHSHSGTPVFFTNIDMENLIRDVIIKPEIKIQVPKPIYILKTEPIIVDSISPSGETIH